MLDNELFPKADFIPDFNLFSCELDNLTFKVLLFYTDIGLKQSKFTILSRSLMKFQNGFFCFFYNKKHFCFCICFSS